MKTTPYGLVRRPRHSFLSLHDEAYDDDDDDDDEKEVEYTLRVIN